MYLLRMKNILTTKKCPLCSEIIHIDAIKCKHCKEIFRNASNIDLTKIIVGFISIFFMACVAYLAYSLISSSYNENNLSMNPDELVSVINEHRTNAGIYELKNNNKLNKAAKNVAQETCNKHVFVQPDQPMIGYYLSQAGYRHELAGIAMAEGHYDVNGLLNSFKDSPQTSENILSEQHQDIGVGIVRCSLEQVGNTDVIVVYFTKPLDLAKVIPQTPSTGSQQHNFANNASNQIECIGPDEKTFTTTMEKCTELNEKWGSPLDYMTNCNIDPDCGGGTIRMSKSQCDKPCSGLEDKINTTNSNSNSNKVPVFLSYYGQTYHCPSKNVDAVKSVNSNMETKKSEWAKKYNECSDLFKKSDSCWMSCEGVADWAKCLNYEPDSPEYNACYETQSSNYLSCIKQCPNIDNYCDYVYFERNTLSNQIKDLCGD